MSSYFKQCLIKTLLNRAIFIPKRCVFSKVSDTIDSALEVKIPDFTIPEFVFQSFSDWPNKIAVECCGTGKKFTYEAVREKSINLDKALRGSLKLKEGDVIAIILPNVPEYPICVLGALQAGLIVATINPMYMPYEIKQQLQETNAKAIITVNTLWLVVQVATKLMPKTLPVLTIKTRNDEGLRLGAISFDELTNTKFDVKDASCRSATDVALIPYSSGTIGLPRGVELTHGNVVANLCQLNVSYFRTTSNRTDNYQSVILNVVPWYHSFGLTGVLFNHLYNMCKIISMPSFVPEKYVTALATYKPSHLHIFPSIVTFMSHEAMVKREYLQPLQNVTSVKAHLSSGIEEQFLDKANKYIAMLEVYGMTETTSSVLVKSPVAEATGEILPNTSIKIIPIDKLCGELLIRGPQVMKGYRNRPEDTRVAFADGWLRTHDLVCCGDNKMFYVSGRLNEMIEVKGNKVAPAELEQIIRSYPHVVEAAVIGIPDRVYGEVPKAYVVAEQGVVLNALELQEFVDGQLSDYKHVRGGITFVNSLPMNAFGEVVKRYLKLQFQAEMNM